MRLTLPGRVAVMPVTAMLPSKSGYSMGEIDKSGFKAVVFPDSSMTQVGNGMSVTGWNVRVLPAATSQLPTMVAVAEEFSFEIPVMDMPATPATPAVVADTGDTRKVRKVTLLKYVLVQNAGAFGENDGQLQKSVTSHHELTRLPFPDEASQALANAVEMDRRLKRNTPDGEDEDKQAAKTKLLRSGHMM